MNIHSPSYMLKCHQICIVNISRSRAFHQISPSHLHANHIGGRLQKQVDSSIVTSSHHHIIISTQKGMFHGNPELLTCYRSSRKIPHLCTQASMPQPCPTSLQENGWCHPHKRCTEQISERKWATRPQYLNVSQWYLAWLWDNSHKISPGNYLSSDPRQV